MAVYQPPGRLHLHAQTLGAWKKGLIISSGDYPISIFISEIDQLSTKHKIGVELKEADGRGYCLANEGLPMHIKADSLAGREYKHVNPTYRITMSAWSQLAKGIER